MASFVGTNEEFKRYIGPMLRNLVQRLTKKYKSEIGCCQHCGATDSLEAAHVHGKDRGVITDKILNDYSNNNVVTIDLAGFEQHFRTEHEVIDETILILCRSCHLYYDANNHSSSRPEPSKKNLTHITHRTKNRESTEPNRLFSNKEIQERISRAAQSLTVHELEKFCDNRVSKEILNINFPLFIRVPKNITPSSKREAVKDSQGMNRWTWKFQFEKEGYLYAITTQWYEKNDKCVKQWLNKHER